MEDIKGKILRAEDTIIKLADEFERAKTVTKQVSIIEQKLANASTALDKGIKALGEAEKKLATAGENTQALMSEAQKTLIETAKSLEDFKRRFENDLQTVSQQNNQLLQSSMKQAEELSAISKLLMNGTTSLNSLKEYKATLEKTLESLIQQNDQLLQAFKQQVKETAKMSKQIKLCLVLLCFATVALIVNILLQLK